MYTYVFMTSIRVIPVSAVLSRVPYEWLYLQKWVTPPLSRTAPLAPRGARVPVYTRARASSVSLSVSLFIHVHVGGVPVATVDL